MMCFLHLRSAVTSQKISVHSKPLQLSADQSRIFCVDSRVRRAPFVLDDNLRACRDFVRFSAAQCCHESAHSVLLLVTASTDTMMNQSAFATHCCPRSYLASSRKSNPETLVLTTDPWSQDTCDPPNPQEPLPSSPGPWSELQPKPLASALAPASAPGCEASVEDESRAAYNNCLYM